MRNIAAWREWRSGIDPLTSVVGLTALIVYALHGFDGVLTRDLGVYSYAGQQVADGVPPYVGILNRAGPLAHLIPAIGVAGARVGGFDDLLGMRLLFMIIAAACVCLVYLLGRDLFESTLAGLAAAAAFLSFSGFIEYASNGPREKTPMVLFLLCALLAVARQRWFAAGLCVSLATLTWQPVFLVGLTAALVALTGLPRSERIPALVRIVVGGVVPASICLLYFALVGALQEFVDAFLLIPARYSVPVPFTSDIAKNWSGLQNGYGVSLWAMIVGLGALAVITFAATRRERRRRDPAAISVVAIGAGSFAGLAWTLHDFNGWPDAFVLLPLAAVGIGGLAKELIERLSQTGAISLTVAWVVVAGAVAVTYSVTERDHGLELERDSVRAVLAHLPPDASILSIEAPQALVLSGKTNPTGYQMVAGGMGQYIDDTWPGGLLGFSAWIGREQPTIIALRKGQVPLWIAGTLRTEYLRVGRVPDWIWYVRRSVGPAVLSALQHATSAVSGADKALPP